VGFCFLALPSARSDHQTRSCANTEAIEHPLAYESAKLLKLAIFLPMKTNLAAAEAAIAKADTLIRNSKTFAYRDDQADNQKALRQLHEAAEQNVEALKELLSALKRLHK
jgi:hypothetical protein